MLKYLAPTIYLPIVLIAVTGELFYLKEISSYKSLKENLSSIIQSENTPKSKNQLIQIRDLVDQTTQNPGLFSGPLNSELAKANLTLGVAETNFKKQVDRLCSARKLYEESLFRSPRDIEYRLGLADLEAIGPLYGDSCFTGKRNRDYTLDVMMNNIKSLTPSDPIVAYRLGLMHRSRGNLIEAMKEFRRFEELSILNAYHMRSFFINQAKNEQQLRELLPRKLPLLLHWYEDIATNQNYTIPYNKAFTLAFEETFTELQRQIERKEIDESKYLQLLQTLFSSPYMNLLPETKSKLAQMILYQNSNVSDQISSQILNLFAKGNKQSIAISQNVSSLAKKTGNIFLWEKSNRKLELDISHGYLGLFLKHAENTQHIILTGSKNQPCPIELDVEAWESHDNLVYQEREIPERATCAMIFNIPHVLITLPKLESSYLKLFFSEHTRPRKVFISLLSSGVLAYD